MERLTRIRCQRVDDRVSVVCYHDLFGDVYYVCIWDRVNDTVSGPASHGQPRSDRGVILAAGTSPLKRTWALKKMSNMARGLRSLAHQETSLEATP